MYPGGKLVKLSPTDLSASAYTEGDIIFAKHELAGAVRTNGGCSLLRSITIFVEGAVGNDDLTLLFFDNSTDLGEPAADPASDISADEFRTASCIGRLELDENVDAVQVANGRLYTAGDDDGSQGPIFIQAVPGSSSIWVACIQQGGTLDLTDTDSITCTFGFQYLD